jgi:hypothetical protein
MLTGAILGALIIILALAVFYLLAQNRAYVGQIKTLGKEQLAADEKLAALAAQVQATKNIPYVINFSDENVTAMANRICSRVQVILEAQQESALQKMN